MKIVLFFVLKVLIFILVSIWFIGFGIPYCLSQGDDLIVLFGIFLVVLYIMGLIFFIFTMKKDNLVKQVINKIKKGL